MKNTAVIIVCLSFISSLFGAANPAGPTSARWGSIRGDINDQNDLMLLLENFHGGVSDGGFAAWLRTFDNNDGDPYFTAWLAINSASLNSIEVNEPNLAAVMAFKRILDATSGFIFSDGLGGYSTGTAAEVNAILGNCFENKTSFTTDVTAITAPLYATPNDVNSLNAPVILSSSSGNRGFWPAADNDANRGSALIAAFAAATNYSKITAKKGRYYIAKNTLVEPNYFTFFGEGDNTYIYGDSNESYGPVISPGSYSETAYMSIENVSTDSIGAGIGNNILAHARNVISAKIHDTNLTTDGDNFQFVGAADGNFSNGEIYNSRFNHRYDNLWVTASGAYICSLYVHDCNSRAYGQSAFNISSGGRRFIYNVGAYIVAENIKADINTLDGSSAGGAAQKTGHFIWSSSGGTSIVDKCVVSFANNASEPNSKLFYATGSGSVVNTGPDIVSNNYLISEISNGKVFNFRQNSPWSKRPRNVTAAKTYMATETGSIFDINSSSATIQTLPATGMSELEFTFRVVNTGDPNIKTPSGGQIIPISGALSADQGYIRSGDAYALTKLVFYPADSPNVWHEELVVGSWVGQ